MRTETRENPDRKARRDEQLTRMSQRTKHVPQYQDFCDYTPRYFEQLRSSISHLDLSRASVDSQYAWRHVK